MVEEKVERKIAVILATDVVGYSTKIEANEDQTIQTLKACRAIIEGLIDEHHGRVFNTAGDSVLAEFPSAVEAVLCASEFQRTIKERNASVEDEAQQMKFRVGINMGDVVIEESNLYGEGVNVAARLEALAQSGGICLSKNVHEIVHKKMNLQFTDLGEQQVKNSVVHAVDVSLEGVSTRKLPGTKNAQSSARVAYLVAGLAIVALIVVGGLWWWQAQPDFKPADISKFAYQLPDKPSIAVIPFNNLSGDPKQDYVGDGLTENIITVLSASPNLMVIARNSSFTFKGKSTKVQAIAEQLGVRYVLDGSVQQSGGKLRVTAQLVDAVGGKQLWSERYDRKLDDLFAVQDDITNRIYEAMEVELTMGEQARNWAKHSSDPEEMRLLTQGRAHFLTFTPEGHAEAERLWGEALEKNPEGGTINLAQGWLQYQKIQLRLTMNPAMYTASAREYAEKAHAIMSDGSSLSLLATLDMIEGRCASAIGHAERAAKIDPSAGGAVGMAGAALITCGKPQEGVVLLKRAMRLEPYHPAFFPNTLSLGLMILGRNEEAEEIASAVIRSDPDNIWDRLPALARLAVINVFKGGREKAREYVRQMQELSSMLTISMLRIYVFRPFADKEFVERYLDGLRQAGLPE